MRIAIVVAAFLVLASSLVSAGTIYTTHGDGSSLGTIDSVTGAGTDIGFFGFSGTYGNAFDLDGTLFVSLGATTLGTADLTTGVATSIGAFGTPLYALEVSSTGVLYGLAWDGTLLTIDKTTGAATSIGLSGISTAMDIAFDSRGTLWATVGDSLWTVDTTTGASTLVSTISGATSVMGLMFDETDTMYVTEYTASGGLFTVDPITGVATLVGPTEFEYPHGGDFMLTSAIPEPSTVALFGLGALMLGGASLRRARRRRS